MYKVEQFEREVKKRFVAQPGQMKLLIVVDKLLTGFDAPPATYLYIDKKMQDHGLFQAICRVNRLDGEDKEYGYVIDYKELFRSFAGVPVEVVRKGIKNLHVGVYPPNGRVRVAAPMRLDDEAVRLAVISRLGWIRRKQKEFESQDRQSQREMVTGESHYFRGRRYLLDVIEEDRAPSVRVASNTRLELRVRPGSDREARERVLHRWYRRQLRQRIPSLIAKWEPRVGEPVAEVRIKKMKTLWGSCNAAARRIWLNLELAKKPPACLEFILMHEMVHFLERHHNDRFLELMDAVMPSWRRYRDELNQMPLAHEDWGY